MAILKSIPIHESKGINNVVDYISDNEKTVIKVAEDDKGNNTEKALSYAEDLEKTIFELDGERSVLVSGYNCNPVSAPEEFQALKIKYEKSLIRRGIDPASRIKGKKAGSGKHEGELVDKEAREAYHFIMSFPEREDLSPQLVHRIGLEFCEKAFPDTKAVVSTHMNTNHLHNHIVRSAYNISSASKYKDNMDNLKRLREISNEISLKYGLEILIDDDMNLCRKGNSYLEQEERKSGKSWKSELQDKIIDCAKNSESWEDFKRRMEECGYGINEKWKYIVYYNLYDDKKRARDTTLGLPFTRDYIKDKYDELTESEEHTFKLYRERIPAIQIMDSHVGGWEKNNYPKLNLYVSRYTLQGRRRSDLELLILAAMKIIDYFTQEIDDRTPKKKVYNQPLVIEPYYIKLKELQQSLDTTIGLGIRDIDHLREIKREEGAKLNLLEIRQSQVKYDLAMSDSICGMIADAKNLHMILNKRGLSDTNMQVIKYSGSTIRKNKADKNPMTGEQRKDLYLKLNESEYIVKYKYDYITGTEAKEAIDFLSGKTDIMPEVVIKKSDWAVYKADKSRLIPFDSEDTVKKKNTDFEESLKGMDSDSVSLLYRYRILCNDLAALGIEQTDFESYIKENDKLKSENKKLTEEILDQKFLYRQYVRMEENLKNIKSPEYLCIEEYMKLDEEQVTDNVEESLEVSEADIIPAEPIEVIPENDRKKKRIKKDIGWGLVDD